MFLSGVSFWPIGLGIGPESDYHFDFSPGSRLVSRASSALAKSGITDNYEDHSRLSWAEYDSKFLQYVLINHHALLKSQLKGRRPSKIARREIVRMFTKSAVAEKIIWHMLAALKKKESKNRLHIYIIYFLSEYLRGNKKSGFFAQKPKGSILEPARLFQQIKKNFIYNK